jgi:hypothetical protein
MLWPTREESMKTQLCVGVSVLLVLCLPLFAQEAKQETNTLTETIVHEDGLFWEAYNRCDAETMSQFFWPDIEFYHDKGGPTLGLAALKETLQKNLCGNYPKFRLRREALAGTVQVYPLQKNGVTYGAVLSGEHYFYINDNGKPEYRDGVAKFFHLWLLKDGTWKMARVVSYDHRAAPYENTKKETTVPQNVLEQYVGTYDAPKTGILHVSREHNLLTLKIGDKQYMLHPESETVFFTTDRDLTFEFVKAGTKVSKLIVREHGAVVEEATAK